MSGRLQVVVKKNRNAAVVLFIVGGCTPCSRWWSWNRRRSSPSAVSGDRPRKIVKFLT